VSANQKVPSWLLERRIEIMTRLLAATVTAGNPGAATLVEVVDKAKETADLIIRKANEP
jgi:hypothetical protein